MGEDSEKIPRFAYESAMAHCERTIKRLWVLCIILIASLLFTNAAWVIYESQFEEISIEQQNEDGYNNYIGNDGDIYNGETDDKN